MEVRLQPQMCSSQPSGSPLEPAADGRLRHCVEHLAPCGAASRPAPAAAGAEDATACAAAAAAAAGAVVTIDPNLSIRAGHSVQRLFELRRQRFARDGFLIVDDFQSHPLLPQLASAARCITAQVNASDAAAVDPTTAYMHRTSPHRGESRSPQWTGAEHVFTRAEAWAIRGALHPVWQTPCFAEFLGSPAVLAFVRRWSGGALDAGQLGLPDATLFVNPQEGDFSEGWHRDVRWHGGPSYLQQETQRQAPDVSEPTERSRWAELQVNPEVLQPAEDGVTMFMALTEDRGCHELVPRSHREWRSAEERAVLRPLGFDWTARSTDADPVASGLYQHGLHTKLSSGVAIHLEPGQGLIRNGVCIHRGRTLAHQERMTMSWGWSRAPSVEALSADPAVIDARSLWMLDPRVREALPHSWMRLGYDRWRATVRDGGRLVDRMNANELELLDEEARAAARQEGSAAVEPP